MLDGQAQALFEIVCDAGMSATAPDRTTLLDVAGAGEEELGFYRGKLQTCAFFFRHELPRTEAMAKLLVSGDQTVADMKVGWF